MCYNIYMHKLYTFPSGLTLVYAGNDAVRSLATGVFVNAGVAYEPAKTAGISHFIEHIVFKGTNNRSSFDIVNEAESIGAQLNAFTAKTYTAFTSVSLDECAANCMDILSDMYFNPLFAFDDLEKEKKVVCEEINESDDTPDDVCLEKLSTAFYSGHPLEKPILGSKKTVNAMDGDVLRAYMKKQYTPSNTVVSVAGNISFDDCVEMVGKYFESGMKKGGTKRAPIRPAEHTSVAAVKKKNISQAHVAFAFPCVGYDDPSAVTVNVLSEVFSAEMSSRLFQSVREKLGLCYTVFGYPSAYENNGSFTIYSAVNPTGVESAVRAIRHEIDLLLDKGITDEELKKGKQQLKTSMVLGQESTNGMMKAFGRYAVQSGKLYDVSAKISEIDAVTADDVLTVARKIFDYDKVTSSLVAKDVSTDILSIFKG